jgi:hypothetical protein
LSSQIGRCHNPKNAGFKHYGARGISVCKEWREDRRKFLAHCKTLDGWDNAELEIDRIDVNGNYEPGNLRFVTKSENASNKRNVSTMQKEIDRLRKENEDLRLALRRATGAIHSDDQPGAGDCP